jgi:hypothetical protein
MLSAYDIASCRASGNRWYGKQLNVVQEARSERNLTSSQPSEKPFLKYQEHLIGGEKWRVRQTSSTFKLRWASQSM